MGSYQGWDWGLGFAGFLLVGGAIFSGNSVLAQITPDATLGTQGSVVTPNAKVRGLPAELIEGGALRGANLFHSFLEFNVGNGQRVYFANPAGIENILSRVTGSNLSSILGTLGVDGSANLFLLNPNGIIFGENARLDVAGSFVASTANSLVFENGSHFSATNPEAPPLLTIKVTPGLQYGSNQPKATIANAGNLAVGQNLTLAGGNLDLQGQLQAGGELTLQAQDTVKVRDRITNPFIASAGGRLLVQGDRIVDIFALNHPASGFFSGGDMVLRSPNSVFGDAHYSTEGDFRIEQLNGGLGDLKSPNDPIIRASGNVSFTSYTGASLHILAGGSVNIGSVIITGTDVTNFINETVLLSDGTSTVTINGSTRPTLDIRAGTTAFGTPANACTGCPLFQPIGLNFPNTPPQSANITINEISINQGNGLVLLTNQYQPNTAPGNIQVRRIRTGADGPFQFPGNGGEIVMDSRGDIIIPEPSPFNPSTIRTNSTNGNAGDITLIANGSFIMRGNSQLAAPSFGQGNAGDINIFVRDSVILTNGSRLATLSAGQGNAGNISIVAGNAVSLTGDSFISAETGSSGGNAGRITIDVNRLELTMGGRILTTSGGTGKAGDISITATDSMNVSLGFVVTGSIDAGDSGNLFISTRQLNVRDGGQVSTVSAAQGNAGNLSVRNGGEVSTGAFKDSSGEGGNLFITASDSVELNGGSLVSLALGTGRAGDLAVDTRRLTAQAGGRVEAGTAGFAQGGTVTVNASESIELSGKSASGTIPTAVSAFSSGGDAPSGKINLTSRDLIVRDGAEITSRSEGKGYAGDISLTLSGNLLSGNDLPSSGGIISSTSTQAGGGKIDITASDIRLRNSSLISTSVFDGTGGGGNINIGSTTFVALEDSDILANTVDGRGGDITIKSPAFLADLFSSNQAVAVGRNPGDLSRFRGNGRVDISAEATGTGTSGNVTLPNVELTRGLAQLPSNLVDAEGLIDRRCSADGGAQKSSFTVTGRGGLPPNPTEPLIGDATIVNWATLNSEEEKRDSEEEKRDSEEEKRDRPSTSTNPTSTTPKQLVEAQGWVISPDGKVILTAQANTVTPETSRLKSPSCQDVQAVTN